MKVFSGAAQIPEAAKGATIAMGAFDGLHLGHKALMRRAKNEAPNYPLGILLFEPPPKLFFAKDRNSSRLATERVTERLADNIGVEVIFTVNFDDNLANMSAKDFISNVIISEIAPSHVVVGYDFRFGKGRSGDAFYLKDELSKQGISVSIQEPILDIDGGRISSTRIRELIQNGEINEANGLLGHAWLIEGIVEHGQKLGRELGYPTANLKLYEQVAPKFGIYAVKVDIGDRIMRHGVANFGRTPTTGIRDALFEVHLLDWDGDLYSRNILVEVHKFLRPEEKFASLEELVVQIGKDAENAREYFNENS
jgi:riboflavin kinase/FMN adenylyltransferase